jgi:hypothetical protein
MKMRNLAKFTVSFWKIYHEKWGWEYFHAYYGKITMDIWNYALRWGEAEKIHLTFRGHAGQVARGVAC